MGSFFSRFSRQKTRVTLFFLSHLRSSPFLSSSAHYLCCLSSITLFDRSHSVKSTLVYLHFPPNSLNCFTVSFLQFLFTSLPLISSFSKLSSCHSYPHTPCCSLISANSCSRTSSPHVKVSDQFPYFTLPIAYTRPRDLTFQSSLS